MKRILSILLLLTTLIQASAQITAPTVTPKEDNDSRYLVGAVPEVDGNIVFTREIALSDGITPELAMAKASEWLNRIAQDERTLYHQELDQPADNMLRHSYILELTFSHSAFSHDFAHISYVLDVRIEGKKAWLSMSHITYKYTELNKTTKYRAEDMISDEISLNKKKDKIYPGYRRFRVKTIDLVDELQTSLQREL